MKPTALLTLFTLSVCASSALAQEPAPAQPAQPAQPEQPPAEPAAAPAAVPAESAPPAEPAIADTAATESAETPAEAAPAAAPQAEVSATEPVAKASSPSEPPMVAFGPHVGLLIPQLFSELGAWPIFGVEVGFILPFDATDSMRRPLQLTLDVLYTQPAASGTEDAPALGEDGQTFDWKLKERILILELGGIWRFMTPGEGLSPFATLGGRMYLMESVLTASSGGADFGENRETKMQFGFVVGGGVEYALGPGSVYGALELGYSDLKQRITGDSNTGALVLDVGYRFMF